MPDGAGGDIRIYYCGGACQKEHWGQHKLDYKAAQSRRPLYRAGELAKTMFNMCSKMTWKFPIKNLLKAENSWIVHPHTEYTSKSHMVGISMQ